MFFCNMMTTLTESLIKLRKSFILSITFVHIAWIYFHIGVFPPLILLHIRTIPLFWNPQICILYSNITIGAKDFIVIRAFTMTILIRAALYPKVHTYSNYNNIFWLKENNLYNSKDAVDEKIKTLEFSRVKKENFSGTTFWVASCNFKVIY